MSAEWETLKARLREHNYSCEGIENQYFKRLLKVLGDGRSTREDRLLLYRDALFASLDPDSARLSLPSPFVCGTHVLKRFGLAIAPNGLLELQENGKVDELLRPVYQLEMRRHVQPFPMDPVLLRKLNDPQYSNYNGAAQQLATRLAITAAPNATLIVNLPSGCG
jgi:ATP-dependent DNA helicase RecQ